MSALTRLFYPLPDFRRTPLSLLRWWESRRLKYNLLVGGTGLVSLAVLGLMALLPPHPWPVRFPPLGIILVYGVLANISYSLGWLIEMAMVRLWGDEAPLAGPVLWRQGVIFSVMLTLLPIMLAGWDWVIRLVRFLAG